MVETVFFYTFFKLIKNATHLVYFSRHYNVNEGLEKFKLTFQVTYKNTHNTLKIGSLSAKKMILGGLFGWLVGWVGK